MKKSDKRSNSGEDRLTTEVKWKKLRKQIRKAQTPKRYEHTLGVEYTAAALAMRYGADMEEAQLAGLLHDCAKCLSNDELLEFCEKHDIPVTASERKSPFLLHGKVGGYLAEKKYKVKNPDVISAIVCHTTGKPGMTMLEKIVFIADYIEPGRKRAVGLTELRKLAFSDLDAALMQILENTLDYLRKSDYSIDPHTEETWKYYRDRADTE